MASRRSPSRDPQNPMLQKRVRLSRACNLCRARKVRCDEQENSCRQCEVANAECITTDPRTPGAKDVRRRAGTVQQDLSTRAYESVPSQAHYPSPTRMQSTASLEQQVQPDSDLSLVSRRLAVMEHQIQQLYHQRSDSISSPGASQSQHHSPFQRVTEVGGTRRDPSNVALLPDRNINFDQTMHHDAMSLNDTPLTFAKQTGSVLSPSQESLNILTGASQEEAFHEDNSSFRRKWLGPSSLQVLTQWLDLSSTIYGGQPISSMFRFGMEHAEEMPLPFPLGGSGGVTFLPHIPERNEYINIFLKAVHPLFPIMDVKDIWRQVIKFDWLSRETTDRTHPPSHAVPPSDRPLLASIYVMVSMGADEKANENTQLGEVYLTAAFSMYGHLVAMPYLPSVQALLLLSIALRERTKDGSAWQTISQAIRIAQSLGLHRFRARNVSGIHEPELDARVWWTAYCLDKVMSFETGRSSMIDDEDCSQTLPKPYYNSYFGECGEAKGPDCFGAFIGLARVQSAISKRLFRQSARSRTPSQLLYETGELDHSLCDWLETVPPEIRPGRDLFCDPSIHSFAVFLALQYHQTLSMLHRSGLLLDTQLLQQQIALYCTTMPWRHRLKASESICLGSARAVVRLLTEDSANQNQSRLLLHTLTSLLLSVYILAIYILKHPQAISVQSDLFLLTGAAQHVKARYVLAGQHPEFCHMVEVLCKLATQRVADPFTRPGSPMNLNSHLQIVAAGYPTHPLDDVSWNYSFPGEIQDPQMMEDLWSRVLGDDLAVSPLANGTSTGLEATYQMFGLLPPKPPQSWSRMQ